MKILLITFLLWRLGLPRILKQSQSARVLKDGAQVKYLLAVSAKTPTVLTYLAKFIVWIINPKILPQTVYASMPSFAGHYVIESAPFDFEGRPQVARWHQDYYYLNLLNGRTIMFIRQYKMLPPANC